jgi:hypothetical protein
VSKTLDQLIVAALEAKMTTEHWKTYLVLHASKVAAVLVVNAEPVFYENCGLVC